METIKQFPNLPEVERAVGVSCSSIYERMKAKLLSKSIKFASCPVGWRKSNSKLISDKAKSHELEDR
jgi:predicted DNA-binding transcriptional regulator AlpA